jgi:GT2 family glycosyltransferase
VYKVDPLDKSPSDVASLDVTRRASLVSIIVVNYNGAAHLQRCVSALLADEYPSRELLIVDNASTDASASILADLGRVHPQIILLRSSQNLGYAGAVNLALGTARGEYVAVLNMDTFASQGWLEPLIAFLEDHPQAGAVNPLVALADGKRVNAMGQDVHVTGLGFNRCLGQPIGAAGTKPTVVSGIHGAAFVVRRTLLDRLGGMDETGFLYHEDVNLSWALRVMGFTLYCVPESVVCHDYFLAMYPAKLHLLERNRLALLLEYLRPSTLIVLSPALIATEALMWGYCCLRGWSFIKAKIASYRWILRRWSQIQQRRQLTERFRVASDWDVLKSLRWSYAWGQFLILARQRGQTGRQPVGGIPKEAVDG